MWKVSLALLCFVCVYANPLNGRVNFDFEAEFENFVKKFNRVYKDNEERTLRYNTFVENMDKMLKDQEKMPSAKFGITKFADWTKEEKHALTGVKPGQLPKKPSKIVSSNYTLPSSFDWRKRNMVTPVKDQGQCGSCWTFQTVALVESRVLLNGQPQILLSEQELVDCDKLYQSDGCNGGWPNAGLVYAQQHGLETEAQYPYKAVNQPCHANYNLKPRTGIKAWEFLGPDENNAAYQLTQVGPLGYDIWVPDSLYNYVSGVWYPSASECQAAANTGEGHAITLVGFGTEGGVPYWLIKNSWGTSWGDQGYFKLHRGNLTCAMGYGIGDNSGDFGDGNEWFVATTK